MNTKRKLLPLGMIVLTIVLSGCPFAIKDVPMSEEKYKANYDNMFEAAIDAGTTLGYHVEFKDKEKGMIKLLKKVMSNDYRILVQFGNLRSYGGQLGFQVFGQTKDIVNPFINSEVQEIIAAINRAADSGTLNKINRPAPVSSRTAPATERLKTTSPEGSEKPILTYLLTIKNSNIRSAPTIKSQIIATIERGTQIEKIGESGDWFEVRLPSGETGHIYKPLVVVIQ